MTTLMWWRGSHSFWGSNLLIKSALKFKNSNPAMETGKINQIRQKVTDVPPTHGGVALIKYPHFSAIYICMKPQMSVSSVLVTFLQRNKTTSSDWKLKIKETISRFKQKWESDEFLLFSFSRIIGALLQTLSKEEVAIHDNEVCFF